MNYSNSFKLALQRGETLYGYWLALAHPYAAEACAGAGYDWLLIDGEHAPNTLPSILAQLQAVAPYPAEAIVRPVNDDRALIKQLLDIGARTLLVPMVETAEQAQAVVAATRYPQPACAASPRPWCGLHAGARGKATWRRPSKSCACWFRSRAAKG
ncbi:aldolase/citrate lyase family protein [Deinococcus lacus]|uniref:Aldolase/citrate lyase family protein n=1 Tax=Deinococcus lacus TaxID=392561 RepID=A0ABW1YJ17_9DEIO